MPDLFKLGTEARLIPATPENPKLIRNGGASTIGRKATSDVTISDNAITSGNSYRAESAFWYVSAASSQIIVEDYGPSVKAGSFKSPDVYTHSGPPVSGTSGYATGVGSVDNGGLFLDSTNGNLYVNENTAESPYYTPVGFSQPGLAGWTLGRRGVGAGAPIADTAATYTLLGSGVRVFGQGKEQNGDSGLVQGASYEGGELNTLHVTNEDLHLTALGTQERIFQPDTHGTMAVDVEFTDVADILTSSIFLGFTGLAADALDPLASGATTTATLNADDLAGMYTNAAMTDVNGIFLISEKSNLSGTHTGLTAVADRPAAGTYSRWRVECTTDGTCIAFFNKAQVGIIPGATGANAHSAAAVALDADEEVSPVFYIENNTTTTRTASVKGFSCWGVIA